MINKIDYFIAAMIFAVLIGICAGVWLQSVAAGFGAGLVIMFIGAMIDFATTQNK